MYIYIYIYIYMFQSRAGPLPPPGAGGLVPQDDEQDDELAVGVLWSFRAVGVGGWWGSCSCGVMESLALARK